MDEGTSGGIAGLTNVC